MNPIIVKVDDKQSITVKENSRGEASIGICNNGYQTMESHMYSLELVKASRDALSRYIQLKELSIK